MHFSKSFAALAALVCGASYVVAAPLSSIGSNTILASTNVSVFPIPSSTLSLPNPSSLPKVPFSPRANPNGLPQVLADVSAKITPLVAELKSFTSSGAPTSNIGPIVENAKAVLSSAITEVDAIAGQRLKPMLAATNGTGQDATYAAAHVVSNALHLAMHRLDDDPAAPIPDLSGTLAALQAILTTLINSIVPILNLGGIL